MSLVFNTGVKNLHAMVSRCLSQYQSLSSSTAAASQLHTTQYCNIHYDQKKNKTL